MKKLPSFAGMNGTSLFKTDESNNLSRCTGIGAVRLPGDGHARSETPALQQQRELGTSHLSRQFG
jgi:hypothetical protein